MCESMYMCVLICVFVYLHVSLCVHGMRTCPQVCTCTCMRARTCVCMHACTHVGVDVKICL